jgi:hypothetical protein
VTRAHPTIPRRIIQTAKSKSLPAIEKAAATNMRLLHPDWEHVLLDDADVTAFVRKEFPQYQATFDGFDRNIQRFDFFRYLAVYRFGGFYFDLDVFLSKSLEPLLEKGCVFPYEELTLNSFLRRQYGLDWEIGNYAFGAAAGDPFLGAIIENCVRAQRDPAWVAPMMDVIPALFRTDFYVLNTTGPGLITRTMAENPQLAANLTVLFPDNVCEEESWHKFGHYGVHLMAASWRGRGGFLRRRLALLWETRLRARQLRESLQLGIRRSVNTSARPA